MFKFAPNLLPFPRNKARTVIALVGEFRVVLLRIDILLENNPNEKAPKGLLNDEVTPDMIP